MKITFLGTRGGIKLASESHANHTVTKIEFGRTSILIDAGLDWIEKIKTVHVDAILITHAHIDHIGALQAGVPCPVYASAEVWKVIEKWPIKHQFLIEDEKPFDIGSLRIVPYAVEHSLRAPATSYRITGGNTTIFHAGDLVRIYNQHDALHNARLYIGDGAHLTRSIIRKHDGYHMGHASIKKQLSWCAKESVPEAIFTHCGSQIVKGDFDVMQQKIELLGQGVGVDALLAYDGMVIKL